MFFLLHDDTLANISLSLSYSYIEERSSPQLHQKNVFSVSQLVGVKLTTVSS